MIRLMKMAAVIVASGFILAGCASKSEKHASLDPFAGKGSPYYNGKGPVPWGGGRRHIGQPYQVAGRWFKPAEQPNYDKTGTASWYGEAFNRRKTSNGEWFDMTRLTAAHPTLPLPSYVKVTNLDNGREVVVRVNDRGPFVGTRVIDLSKRTAEVLEFKGRGKANVRVQYIGEAPVNDNGTHLVAMNKELNRGTPLRRMIAAAGRGRGGSGVSDVMVAEFKPKKVIAAPKTETVAFVPSERQVTPEQSNSGMESNFFVQLGSFSDPDNAARARDQFANVWPVQFIELTGSNGPVYRVRLGPIADLADADTALSNARSAGYSDARMIRAEAMQASLQ
jgi:rare lipoprotein A